MLTIVKSGVKVCQRGKETTTNARLYTSRPRHIGPWIGISMDFLASLPRCLHGWDSIFVVVDCFSNTVHFIPCKASYDSSKAADMF